jgi:outer membrane protein assembly factor BamD
MCLNLPNRLVRSASAVAVVAVLALAVFSGCSSGPDLGSATYEGLYDIGREALETGNYLLAIEAFRRLTAESPLHESADDAVIGLGDAYRETEDYATAEAEYRRLLSDYPRSPLVQEAEYKIGLTYQEQSLPSPLDQGMTHRAIDQYRRFLDLYPGSDLANDARDRILELRTKLAAKTFHSAELYLKLRAPEAARVYAESVVSEYPETVWAPRALLLAARSHYVVGENAEALEYYQRVMELYPDSEDAAAAASESEGL